MEPTDSSLTVRVARLADRAFLILIVGLAFVLGCQELVDSDIWWHLRAGRWIMEQRRFPDLDPFTFASADRPWIDLHWLFQVAVAAVFALGGVRGVILLAATVCATAFLVAATAGIRRWPGWVAAACWPPAVVLMSARFGPRPEVFTLLAMAAYLAVLTRVDAAAGLAWVLPPIQVLWVNVHGLFVLGPVILGFYLADRLAGGLVRSRSSPVGGSARRWVHLGGASAAVAIACMANPYGLRGALFPLELFPKITAWGGLSKSYIAEFMELRSFVRMLGVEAASSDVYIRAACFVLWALPLTFLVPAA